MESINRRIIGKKSQNSFSLRLPPGVCFAKCFQFYLPSQIDYSCRESEKKQKLI